MITISLESADELLNLLYRLGGIPKLSTGDYVIFFDEGGWSPCTPEDAAESLSKSLKDVDLVWARVSALSGASDEIPMPEIIITDSDGTDHKIEFLDETEYGEPQAWVYLKDGSSIETTHEEYGLEPNEQYFSLRHHCSEEDFENDVYLSTMGVIDECSGGLAAIAPMLQRITDAIGISDDPHDDSKTIVLSSKTLAGYEDEFEDKLFHAAHDLLHDCTQGHGIPDYDAFAQACLNSDLHNYVKTGFYDLFSALGFNISSDGSSF